MTTCAQSHSETAAEFLADARVCLAGDDLLRASEKGWATAALAVKVVAESRGWDHDDLRALHQTVDWLVTETGNEELHMRFNAAQTLHANFYDDFLSAYAIGHNLDGVERFVELLRPLTP